MSSFAAALAFELILEHLRRSSHYLYPPPASFRGDSIEDPFDGEMSRDRRGQKLDLKLNLPLVPARGEASRRRRRRSGAAAAESEEASSPSSCLSSEAEQGSPAEGASMVVGGCPRCLMYVMLSAADLRCPRCGTDDVLFDFCGGGGGAAAKSSMQGGKKS